MAGRGVNSFKQLKVWQGAQELAVELYRLTKVFPSEERYGLTRQIQRAAASVGANIAEGFGRGGGKEKIQFYNHARGSLLELESHIDLATKVGLIQSQQSKALLSNLEIVHKQLNALITSVRTHLLTTKA